MNNFLPYSKQSIDKDDIKSVEKVLKSNFLTTGPEVLNFENKVKDIVGARFCVSCNSGTSGLHLASLSAGIAKNDNVIVPTVTFAATANAPKLTGANVIFSDVDPKSGLMTKEHFLDALNKCKKLPKAVFPVHLNGHHVDLREIRDICLNKNILIIEDACHAFGGKIIDDKNNLVPTGSCHYSDMTVFSFHPVKAIATGEGGVVTTNNKEFAHKLKSFRNHGLTRNVEEFSIHELAYDENDKINSWYYEIQNLGFNYRISDINCALGLSQLRKLNNFINKKTELSNYYDKKIKENFNNIHPIKKSKFGISGYHLYPILVDFEHFGFSKNYFMEKLKSFNIGTQVHYIPVHLQPLYRTNNSNTGFNGAKKYYRNVISLPFYPDLSHKDIDYIISSISKIVEN